LGSVSFDQSGEHLICEIAPGRPQDAGLRLRNRFRSISQNVIHNALACSMQLGMRNDLVNEADTVR
jgi:hypothetical protein